MSLLINKVRLLPLLLAVGAVCLHAQTTQGLISGRVTDSETGLAIAGVLVCYEQPATNTVGIVYSGKSGYYTIPGLPPGEYGIRAIAEQTDEALRECLGPLNTAAVPTLDVKIPKTQGEYQPQQLHALELPVAGRLTLDLEMRPLASIWEKGLAKRFFFPESDAVLTFYGPDVDTSRYGTFAGNTGSQGALQATISNVIDPVQVRRLPFAGRDVYTMLVTLPGVVSDAGTGRGLGLSINGQRPSASNFLLDGLENNNSFLIGPLSTVAPEAIQEYRVSTANFSAEYGRTSGFLANAVTRSGGNEWHGIGYFNLRNDWLNANDFQRNRAGQAKTPLKEVQPGFHVGGPIRRNRIFYSAAFERLRNRSLGNETTVFFPGTEFVNLFNAAVPTDIATDLMARFPPPVEDTGDPMIQAQVRAPSAVDRYLLLQRADYLSNSGTHRVMVRAQYGKIGQPDFVWSPYKDFTSDLNQPTVNLALNHTYIASPGLINEFRFGWKFDDLTWDRAHPEIPTLVARRLILPGSPAFAEFKNAAKTWEFNNNIVWSPGRHIIKIGGGFLLRNIDGYLTSGRDGQIEFSDIVSFARDGRQIRGRAPTLRRAALRRDPVGEVFLEVPNYDRRYRYSQQYFFAQDAYRASSRLTLNLGVRYERLGSPSNVGQVKDALLAFGDGSSIRERVSNADFIAAGSGDQQIYNQDNNDWAGRVGLTYGFGEKSRTIFRAAAGIFYDRPFDNLWQNVRNNGFVLPTGFEVGRDDPGFLTPLPEALPTHEGDPFIRDFPKLTTIDSDFRSAYSQSLFGGIQRQLGRDLFLEVNYVGTFARKLITTDIVNRQASEGFGQAGRLNEKHPVDFSYRANQGSSSYHAMTMLARYRPRRGFLQVSYTWSHSIDNQSEPLAGDFFDFQFSNPLFQVGSGRSDTAAFSEQFNSSGDRGNSSFDQRHNLVIFSLWDVPQVLRNSPVKAMFRNWQVSQISAFRTGFPYSVIGRGLSIPGNGVIFNPRADLLNPGAANIDRADEGGRLLLSSDAFANAPRGRVGTSGSNAFRGPGLYSLDLSLSRHFSPGWLGEYGRFTLRADAFNALNHSNLNNPENRLNTSSFGFAQYGRLGVDTGAPSLTPFNETPRQFQLLLRFEF